jgi:hypothetical protein
MKNRVFLVPLVVLALAVTGCGKVQSAYSVIKTAATYKTAPETADAIIVDAEKTTAIAADTMNEFVDIERQYSAMVKQHAPKVHEFAEYLRAKVSDPTDAGGKTIPRGVALLKTARSATKTFKANRTAQGEANLKSALATVKDLLAKTKESLKQVEAVKGP